MTQTNYQPGAVVNGHVLTPDLRWVPVPAPLPAPLPASPQTPVPRAAAPADPWAGYAPVAAQTLTPYPAGAGRHAGVAAPYARPTGRAFTFAEAVQRGFSRTFTFRGRATRAEFYWFFLLALSVQFVGGFIDGYLSAVTATPTLPLLSLLTWLIFVIPTLSLSFRRLHDCDVPAWIAVVLAPVAAGLLMLVALKGSTPGPNKHGLPSTP